MTKCDWSMLSFFPSLAQSCEQRIAQHRKSEVERPSRIVYFIIAHLKCSYLIKYTFRWMRYTKWNENSRASIHPRKMCTYIVGQKFSSRSTVCLVPRMRKNNDHSWLTRIWKICICKTIAFNRKLIRRNHLWLARVAKNIGKRHFADGFYCNCFNLAVNRTLLLIVTAIGQLAEIRSEICSLIELLERSHGPSTKWAQKIAKRFWRQQSHRKEIAIACVNYLRFGSKF